MDKYIVAACCFCLLLVLCNCTQPQPESIVHSDQRIIDSIQAKRYGWVIKIKEDRLDEYKALHANPWPGVMEQIRNSNIRNYSIYLKDDYLFGYFEYVGNNFDEDMAKMAEDSLTQEWWKLTDPCQNPLPTRAQGEWWAQMEEIFHID